MKLHRKKLYRKNLRYFALNFNFQPPFRILVHKSFIEKALEMKMPIKESLQTLMGGSCIPVTTSCMMDEIRSLGPDASGVAILAKQLYRQKCLASSHKADQDTLPCAGHVSSFECIQRYLGCDNPLRFCVAANELDLVTLSRNIPGVPLILFQGSSMHLESPSTLTRKVQNKVEKTKLKATYDLPQNQKSTVKISRNVKKKKKQKNPNPLSCQSKKHQILTPILSIKRVRSKRLKKQKGLQATLSPIKSNLITTDVDRKQNIKVFWISHFFFFLL